MTREQWFTQIETLVLPHEKNEVFNEVKNTYIAKLDRACYIMSWICLIESLKNKIKDLSQLGNTEADKIEKEIIEKENAGLSVDKFIIESSDKLLIIDLQENMTLNFLWSQRCLFAHPYHIQPTELEVQFIINKIIEISLSKELIFNNKSLNEIIENIVNKPYFLSNDNQVITYYIENLLKRTKSKSFPFIFKTIIFKLSSLLQDPSKNKTSKKLILLLKNTIRKADTPINVNEWSFEHRLTNWPYETIMGIATPELWPKINNRIKDLIVGYLLELENTDDKIRELKIVFKNLLASGYLEENYSTQIISKFDTLDFSNIIQYYPNEEEKFKRIIKQLSEPNYIDQNPCISKLEEEAIINLVNNLQQQNKLLLASKILNLANSGNYKANSFVKNIPQKYNTDFKERLIIGCFLNRNMDKYSIKAKLFVVLLTQFSRIDLNHDDIIKSIAKINDTIFESSQKDLIKMIDQKKFDGKSLLLSQKIVEIFNTKIDKSLELDF